MKTFVSPQTGSEFRVVKGYDVDGVEVLVCERTVYGCPIKGEEVSKEELNPQAEYITFYRTRIQCKDFDVLTKAYKTLSRYFMQIASGGIKDGDHLSVADYKSHTSTIIELLDRLFLGVTGTEAQEIEQAIKKELPKDEPEEKKQFTFEDLIQEVEEMDQMFGQDAEEETPELPCEPDEEQLPSFYFKDADGITWEKMLQFETDKGDEFLFARKVKDYDYK